MTEGREQFRLALEFEKLDRCCLMRLPLRLSFPEAHGTNSRLMLPQMFWTCGIQQSLPQVAEEHFVEPVFPVQLDLCSLGSRHPCGSIAYAAESYNERTVFLEVMALPVPDGADS